MIALLVAVLAFVVVAPPDSTDGPADERSTDAEAKPATPPPRSRGPPEPVQCRRTARRPGLTGHPVPSTRNQVLFTPKSKPFSTERLAVRPRHRTQRNTDRVKQVTTNRGHCPPPQPLVRIHRIGCPESTGTGVRNHRNAHFAIHHCGSVQRPPVFCMTCGTPIENSAVNCASCGTPTSTISR